MSLWDSSQLDDNSDCSDPTPGSPFEPGPSSSSPPSFWDSTFSDDLGSCTTSESSPLDSSVENIDTNADQFTHKLYERLLAVLHQQDQEESIRNLVVPDDTHDYGRSCEYHFGSPFSGSGLTCIELEKVNTRKCDNLDSSLASLNDGSKRESGSQPELRSGPCTVESENSLYDEIRPIDITHHVATASCYSPSGAHLTRLIDVFGSSTPFFSSHVGYTLSGENGNGQCSNYCARYDQYLSTPTHQSLGTRDYEYEYTPSDNDCDTGTSTTTLSTLTFASPDCEALPDRAYTRPARTEIGRDISTPTYTNALIHVNLNKDASTTLYNINTSARIKVPSLGYRVIKRAESYRAAQALRRLKVLEAARGRRQDSALRRHPNGSNANANLNSTTPPIQAPSTLALATRSSEPPTKKQKLKTRSSSSRRAHFACGPASLRRAASLRSVPENEDDENDDGEGYVPVENQTYGIPTPSGRHIEIKPARIEIEPEPKCAPTVPVTPEPHKRGVTRKQRAYPMPVPIIAPPQDHMARLPLGIEACAKVRLRRIVEREGRMRKVDGLESGGSGSGKDVDASREKKKALWEHQLGIREVLRVDIVEWILEVLPVYDGKDDDSDSNDEEEQMFTSLCSSPVSGFSPICSPSASSTSSISPPSLHPSKSSTDTSSCFYFMSTTHSPAYDSHTLSDLHDQLYTSPETRFHAAYMFLRYFYLVGNLDEYNILQAVVKDKFGMKVGPEEEIDESQAGDGDSDGDGDCNDSGSDSDLDRTELESDTGSDPGSGTLSRLYLEEGREMVTWDTAVACLALSVKYHRDFLRPLLPVYACEFQALAPQSLSYGDFEASQRDVFSALSYNLGVTPQAILDELWIALPALRELCSYEGGRNRVQGETWGLLFGAILEPDVLQFPIWLLTACALVEGLMAALVCKYEWEVAWHNQCNARRSRGRVSRYVTETRTKLKEKMQRRAGREMEGVLLDLQAVLGVTEATFVECRRWLENIDC